jgi:hypothetical protein
VIPTEEKDRYIASLEYADVGNMEPFYKYVATREIESQNLWLRGARGESMEDVEKEAAILKASLRNPQKKVIPLILEKKIRRTIFEVFEPLIEFASKKLRMFDDFFEEHGMNLLVTEISAGDRNEDFESLKKLPVESFRLRSIRVTFFWNVFKINPNTFAVPICINFNFSETGYSVTSEYGLRPPAASYSKVFGESLSDLEQTTLIHAVSSQFLYYIRLIADEAGYEIPNFSSQVL